MGDTTIVSFPELLPDSAPEPMPGIRYFDPGVSANLDDSQRLIPGAMPMSPAEAAGWLAQATGYAGIFKPGDLRDSGAAAGAKPSGKWAADPTSAIVTQLLVMEHGAAPGAPSSVDEVAFRAQSVLLLAWEREHGMVEMSGLDKAYGSELEKFGQSLGLDEDDREELAQTASELKVDVSNELYATPDDWKPVLAAFLRLLPPEVILFSANASVAEFWADIVDGFEPLAGESLAALIPDAAPGSYSMARCAGYRLLGKTRLPEDSPWLEKERTVVIRLGGGE